MPDLTGGLGLISSILAALGIGGGAAGQRWIGEGDRALVKRFGKAVRYKDSKRNRAKDRVGKLRVLGPGFNIIIPAIDHLAKTHIRQRVVNLGDEEITLSDMTVFTVDGVLVYRVGDNEDDLYQALFEVDNLENAVRLYCISILREVVREMTYKDLISGDPQQIAAKLKEKVTGQLTKWGLVVESFGLGDLAPYGETLRMIQAPAAAKLKVTALQEATKDLDALPIDPRLAAAIIGVPVSVAVTEPIDTGAAAREKLARN